MSSANKQDNPKMKQFLEEINKVCDHYQYVLKPTLNLTPQGIFPQLTVIDKPPKPMESPENSKSGDIQAD